jgi:hypothetical protein
VQVDEDEPETLLERLMALADRFVGGVLQLTGLTVGSKDISTGITIYDIVTGKPYCSVVANGETRAIIGTCEEADFDDLDTNTDQLNNVGETDETEELVTNEPDGLTDSSTTTVTASEPDDTPNVASSTEDTVDPTGTTTTPVVDSTNPETDTATSTEEVAIEPETATLPVEPEETELTTIAVTEPITQEQSEEEPVPTEPEDSVETSTEDTMGDSEE